MALWIALSMSSSVPSASYTTACKQTWNLAQAWLHTSLQMKTVQTVARPNELYIFRDATDTHKSRATGRLNMCPDLLHTV